jgi:2,3-bisphosphoglycerate-dependent phosphoglycerate mutase
MEALNQLWLPVDKSWRLNERHYGALQGMNKDEATQQIGQKIVYHWRRSYRGISPPLPDAPASLHREARYRHVSLTDLPGRKSGNDATKVVALLAPRHCPARRQWRNHVAGQSC